MACADDVTGCGTTEPNDHHASRASLSVTAGQTYFIVVDGFDGASGTFTLTVMPPSGAAPTATRTATPVRTATPTPTAVATASATRTATPLATPSATVTPAAADHDAYLDAGPHGHVPARRHGLAGTLQSGSRSHPRAARSRERRAAPAHSRVPAPSPVPRPIGCTSGRPPRREPRSSRTCGATSFDTALYVRSGSCQGTQVACNDDTAGCGTSEPNDHHASRATLAVTAGQTYFIVVDGYNGASGNYTLTITPPRRPDDDPHGDSDGDGDVDSRGDEHGDDYRRPDRHGDDHARTHQDGDDDLRADHDGHDSYRRRRAPRRPYPPGRRRRSRAPRGRRRGPRRRSPP